MIKMQKQKNTKMLWSFGEKGNNIATCCLNSISRFWKKKKTDSIFKIV